MIYTKEVENMCIVNRDANHGPAPSLKRENGCRQKKSKIFPV